MCGDLKKCPVKNAKVLEGLEDLFLDNCLLGLINRWNKLQFLFVFFLFTFFFNSDLIILEKCFLRNPTYGAVELMVIKSAFACK